jgi:hypothetical protein
MASRAVVAPVRSTVSVGAWVLIVIAVVGGVALLGRSGPEGQMYVALSAITALVAAFALPRAAARDGAISVRFLVVALAAHVLGSLLRYAIIQSVYHGVADANGYFGAGQLLAPEFRSLSIPAIPAPYFGTPFIDWSTGLLYAFTGPTLLGGFVVHSVLSFVGAWFFYRAFRLAFPEGNHELYAFLIFLLPSMWYWPSSLGKDGLIMLFLGLATYGFARLFTGGLLRGLLLALAGLGGAFMVRPPVAATLAVAGAAAFLLRPARTRSLQVTGLMWIVFVPLLAVVAYFAIGSTTAYLGQDSAIEAFEAQQSIDFQGQGEDSNFDAPTPFSPAGFVLGVVTVNFRPFPWEAGGPLPALTAMEGLVLLAVLVWRRREILRGLARWRASGMVLLAVGAWLGLSIILASLTNFGLLARQRTQVLPFLFMFPAMVRSVRGRRSAGAERA